MNHHRKTRTLTLVLIACLCAQCLAGCNTMEGVGEDISDAGQGMADLARDANPNE